MKKMKNGRKLSNRILAIILSLVLSVGTFYGDYALTRAEGTITETAVEESASESAEESTSAPESNDVSAPSEEPIVVSTEEAIVAEESTAAETVADETVVAGETLATEEATEATEETVAEGTASDATEETIAEETEETVVDETAEDVSGNDVDEEISGNDVDEEISGNDVSENDVSENDVEEEVAYDLEFRESVEIDGLRITLYAAPDILPNDARLDVKKVSYTLAQNAEKAIDEATGDNVEVVESYTYDITIQSATLGEVQPKNGTVSLTFEEVVDENEATS